MVEDPEALARVLDRVSSASTRLPYEDWLDCSFARFAQATSGEARCVLLVRSISATEWAAASAFALKRQRGCVWSGSSPCCRRSPIPTVGHALTPATWSTAFVEVRSNERRSNVLTAATRPSEDCALGDRGSEEL
jgi:hypothetical protein